MTTVAGTGRAGSVDGSVAEFRNPEGLAVAPDGALYVTDTGNNLLRRIAQGVTSTVAGSTRGGHIDGPFYLAQFEAPAGVLFNTQGQLLIVDRGNAVVRAADLGARALSTVVGKGQRGHVDGSVSSALFRNPSALALGDILFVADTGNDALRAVYYDTSVVAVHPREIPVAGAPFRLFGTGFVAPMTVTVQGRAATMQFMEPSLLVVNAPPASMPGIADVIVTTPTRTLTVAGGIEYVADPVIESMTPSRGATAGGDRVTITGKYFVPGHTSVWFGSARGAVVSVTSTTIVVDTPAQTAGAVDVRVETNGGSATRLTAFTYVAPPRVDLVAPTGGFPGSAVTITGANFDPAGTAVLFGAVTAIVENVTPTQITTRVPAGATTARISITTVGGTAVSPNDFVVPTYTALTVVPSTASLFVAAHVQLSAVARYSDGSTRDVTTNAQWQTSDATIVSVDSTGRASALAPGTVNVTASFEGRSTTATIVVTAGDGSIPDPITVAPKLDPTVPVSFADSTRFLYAGARPVQIGVVAGTIVPERVGIIRGRVLDRAGQPVEGVTVSLVGHPELGYTRTRVDGLFDLAVNAGGALTVRYAEDGYLPVDRRVATEWLRFHTVDDVILVPLDAAVTRVDLSSTLVQPARATAVADAHGTRRATLLFSPGTTASLVMGDGSTQSIGALNVRATEYTVGASGQAAMPAVLPERSGYTYCVELSADEAIAAGASSVSFSQPVVTYVENFLGFPVGGSVPAGYYDRAKAAWIPAKNGRIIKILTVAGTSAMLDITGDDVADDAAALATIGITPAEIEQLASLYSAGTSLWRVPVTHFTPWDYNWPYTFPPDAIGPGASDGTAEDLGPDVANAQNVPEGCTQPGSVIDCHNQSLAERAAVTGTPYTLHYNSTRVPGPRARIQLRLSGNSPLPASIKAIDSVIEIGGRSFRQRDAAMLNAVRSFEWDGKDPYDRTIQGSMPFTVRIGYVYSAVYATPAQLENNFASPGGAAFSLGADRSRFEFTIWREWHGEVEAWDDRERGFGGWSVDVHHVYDPRTNILFLGDGTRRDVVASHGAVAQRITPIVGNAILKQLKAAPDGSFYCTAAEPTSTGRDALTIWRLDATSARRFAGSTTPSASGAPDKSAPNALNAYLGQHHVIGVETYVNDVVAAVGEDGSVYIAYGGMIRRIAPNLELSTIAGGGSGPDGEGVPAISVPSVGAFVAMAPDGTFYIGEETTEVTRLRHIDRAGSIRTIATWPWQWWDAYGYRMRDVTVTPDGQIYVALLFRGNPYFHEVIFRLEANGVQTLVAGGRPRHLSLGDGGPATEAAMGAVSNLSGAPDGSLYFVDDLRGGSSDLLVRGISPDGIIATVVGNTETSSTSTLTTISAARLDIPSRAMDVGADGRIVVLGGDFASKAVMRIGAATAGGSLTDLLIPSDDGGEVYVFSAAGRHLRTVDSVFGTVLYSFGYDGNGRLISITDRDNNVTTVERTGIAATAIVSPYGHRIGLAVDGDGYLSTITDPASQVTSFTYYSGGLLQSMTDVRRGVHQYVFDADGRLIRDQNPGGGSKTLTRTETETEDRVSLSTAMGRTTKYSLERLGTGASRRKMTSPSLLITISTWLANATRITQTPTGSVVENRMSADSRFALQAPTSSVIVTTPDGISTFFSYSRHAYLQNATDPLSVTRYDESFSISGDFWNRSLTMSNRTAQTTSPEGRKAWSVYDAKGRLTSVYIDGLTDVGLTYNARGDVQTMTQGVRTFTFGYDPRGNVETVTDPVQRVTRFVRDALGRITSQTLPGNRMVSFGYDAVGNPTSVVPPGRPGHIITYTPNGLTESYTAPAAAGTTSVTRYRYNLDDQIEEITRPDGSPVSFMYDAAGRLRRWSGGGVATDYAYDASGRVSTASVGGVVLTFAYDGHLPTGAKWTGTVQGAVAVAYDYRSLIQSETVGGDSVNFTYDRDGLLKTAGAITLFRDLRNGRMTATQLGSIADSHDVNGFAEPSTYSARVGSTLVLSFTYTRDNLGRITKIVENQNGTAATREYFYDPAGHLFESKLNGASVRYEYDANGNRQKKIVGSITESGTYDDQDRLLTYGAASFTYTLNGEIATKTVGSGTTRFEYTLGMLTKVTLPSGTVVEYVLDPAGRRVARKINGMITHRWLYSGALRVAAEVDAAGAVITRFVYASRQNIPDYVVRDGVTYRILSDHLGSPRMVIDTATGTVAESFTYDEFGNLLTGTNGSQLMPFGFAGGQYDPATRLVRFGSREYDPSLGRWTSKDPSLFRGGTNVYRYAYNDPVNYIDSDGQIPVPLVTGVIGGAVGGLTSIGMQLLNNSGAGLGAAFRCIDWGDVGIAAGTGFLAGMAAPFTATTWLGAIGTSALANEVQYAATETSNGREPEVTGALWSIGTGAVAGTIGGKFTPVSAGYNAESVITSAEQRKLFKVLNDEATNSSQVAAENMFRNIGGNVTAGAPTPGGSQGGCGCQ